MSMHLSNLGNLPKAFRGKNNKRRWSRSYGLKHCQDSCDGNAPDQKRK